MVGQVRGSEIQAYKRVFHLSAHPFITYALHPLFLIVEFPSHTFSSRNESVSEWAEGGELERNAPIVSKAKTATTAVNFLGLCTTKSMVRAISPLCI
jgi:hypothetical protein